jgi:hypothetical protein
MKIRSVGAEMFHADGRTDGRHDEANSRFFAILRPRGRMSYFSGCHVRRKEIGKTQ